MCITVVLGQALSVHLQHDRAEKCCEVLQTLGAWTKYSFFCFSMCRPIEKLDKQVLLDATGRIGGYDVSLKQYDVLSAFSMSYRGQRVNDVDLAGSPSGELPPFPETVKKPLARKGPWCVEPLGPVEGNRL